jgi:hypothetical protein
LPVVLYGLDKNEEYKLDSFENRMLRRLFRKMGE